MNRGRRLVAAWLVLTVVTSCTGSERKVEETTSPTPLSLIAPGTATSVTMAEVPAPTTTKASQASVGLGEVCRSAAVESESTNPNALPGAERVDAFGIPQVWVPPGIFTMGTVNGNELDPPGFAIDELEGEQPAHEVTITNGFWIDKYEVTVAAYKAFDAAGGYQDPACWSVDGWEWRQNSGEAARDDCIFDEPDLPRSCVNWYEAEAYATWRDSALPTEAQWEYAARGPESRIYPWGDEWDPQNANVVDARGTALVGSYPNGMSWVGAHDMSGNVMEWVADWLSFDYFAESPNEDPIGPAAGDVKVEKGGWWGNVPYVARSAYRHFEDPPQYRDGHIGFRVISPSS